MGSGNSKPERHVLLNAVDCAINRFFDDFPRKLIDETPNLNTISEPQSPEEKRKIKNYIIEARIGKGAQGCIFKAKNEITGQIVALKEYYSKGKQNEVEIANQFNHPYLIRGIDSFEQEDGTFVYVLPFSEAGSFPDSTSEPELTVNSCVKFLLQIGSALKEMHSHGYAHCDVKPANILIFDKGFVLSDLSISKRGPEYSGLEGTPTFRSPEMSINGFSLYPADMWALGVATYSLLFGKFPYGISELLNKDIDIDIKNQNPIVQLMNDPRPVLIFPDLPVIPEELKDILRGLLEIDSNQRMTSAQLVDNVWLNNTALYWDNILSYVSSNTFDEHLSNLEN